MKRLINIGAFTKSVRENINRLPEYINKGKEEKKKINNIIVDKITILDNWYTESVRENINRLPEYINKGKEEKKKINNIIVDKITSLNNWYTKSIRENIHRLPEYINKRKEDKKKINNIDKIISKVSTKVMGLNEDEDRLHQDKVTALQEQLLNMQMKLRDLGQQLADIRQQSLEFQNRIHKLKGQDNLKQCLDTEEQLLNMQMKRRDLGQQLADIRQQSLEFQNRIHKPKGQDNLKQGLDTQVLKLENSIAQTFQDYNQTEGEMFTAFCNEIRNSHKKQRAQIEFSLGLILCVTGSLLAYIYSTSGCTKTTKRNEQEFIAVPVKLSPQQKKRQNKNSLLNKTRDEDLTIQDLFKIIGGFCLMYIAVKMFPN